MEMDKIIEISDDKNNHNGNNNYGKGNNLQGLENSINALNQWILPSAPLHIRNSNTNNNAKTNIPKSYQRKNKNNAKKIIQFKRKVIILNKNESSTNILTEEIKGTTDMQLLTSDEGSLLNQEDDNEPTESLLVQPETEPSRVLPDTEFHTLFSTDETVDLTTKDNTQNKKEIIRQKKTPKRKKAVASKSDKSLTTPRPKRACAIDKVAENKKSGLCKLGKQKDGSWALNIKYISSPMFQCPICDVFYQSPESRKTHEVLEHSSLLESIHKPVDIVSTPGNTACIEQLTLFNYLKLCETSKYKTTVVHELAKRKHLLKAFNTKGLETIGQEAKRPKIIDFFKCNYCLYETNLIFALLAHMTSKHLYLKCDSEKKPFLYCFLCDRTLTKRTKPLRHLDACINKLSELSTTNNSPKQFICALCDEGFDSLIELEKHTWGHAKK
ncbi:uncharacterized protein LOC132936124 [Metopolophium dirhodum]|uniref:uncharacterized protein LOC132936124 n=1 Tax=Metopolophium dirhodum TaxID=44670 RepID=UPI00298FBE53|nr:uncharacterized protein LOC132936124 [Metopolophium dirhodum]